MKARNRKSLRGLMVTGLLVAILFLNGCSYEELACEVRDYLQLNNEEQVLLGDEDSGAVSARELEDVELAELKRLLAEGYSIRDCAEEMGKSKAAVQRLKKKLEGKN